MYNFRLEVIEAFLSRSCDVFIIAPKDEYTDKLVASGVHFIELNLHNYSTSVVSEGITFLQLLRIYWKYNFDHIVHYTIKPNIYGNIAAFLSKTDSTSVVTGLGMTFQFSKFTQFFVNKLYAFALRKSKEIWFLNEENRLTFIEKGLVCIDKTLVLPSEGINMDKFVSERNPGKQSETTVFLFAGRLLKDKGVLEFVNAAKEVSQHNKKTKFEIAGFINSKNPNSINYDDIKYWQAKRWIDYLGSHQDIRPIIDQADCVVFPSYYEEGISRILLESASMSKPIITTDQTGCKEVVHHGETGLIIRKKNTVDLINAIEYILDLSPKERQEYGRKGRELVRERFDQQQVIECYLKRICTDKSYEMRIGGHTRNN